MGLTNMLLFSVAMIFGGLFWEAEGILFIPNTCPKGYHTIGGSCYQVNHGPKKNWNAARDDCRRKKANLAYIPNMSENNALNKKLRGNIIYWIGLNDLTHENQFTWTSGQPDIFHNWGNGEPNDAHGGKEECAQIVPRAGGRWNDGKCGDRRGWICSQPLKRAVPSLAGPPGPRGPSGPKGAAGRPGIGLRGRPGPGGPKGVQGHRGLTGGIGKTGPAGPKGGAGQQGKPGPHGPQGLRGFTVRGKPGPKGDTGSVGANGKPGPAGPVGPPGNVGAQGGTGKPGANGPAGPQGEKGEMGTHGNPGPPGTGGLGGPPGDVGSQGPVGPAGKNGSPGLNGLRGPGGKPGHQGAPGERGVKGMTGEKGAPGVAGAAGIKGNPGVAGPQGDLGPKGHQGSVGPVGPKGEPGPKGPIGVHGVHGLHGLHGLKGDPGQPGAKGEKGHDGASGPQGERGLPGPLGGDGPAGPVGSKGEQGPVGLAGPPGGNGVAGSPGTVGIAGPRGLRGAGAIVFVKHSQTNEVPACPPRTLSFYNGFSYLLSGESGKGESQDLGKAGSCLIRFDPVPLASCNRHGLCSNQNVFASWLTIQNGPHNEVISQEEAKKIVSRCSVCVANTPIVAHHSQSADVPECPNGWQSLWQGYSFAGVTSEGGQPLASPGSCLETYIPNPYIDCLPSGKCSSVSHHSMSSWLRAAGNPISSVVSRCSVCRWDGSP